MNHQPHESLPLDAKETNGSWSQSQPAVDGLTPEQREEALAVAEAAKRAEEKAEQRALERALRQKEEERQQLRMKTTTTLPARILAVGESQVKERVVFIPKRKRNASTASASIKEVQNHGNGLSHGDGCDAARLTSLIPPGKVMSHLNGGSTAIPLDHDPSQWLSEKEREAIKANYLGKQLVEEDSEQTRKKLRTGKKITFKFRWDDTDDTFQDDDLLYSNMLPSQRRREALKADNDAITSFDRVSTKPLEKMTSRDWRIIRENYEINVKGGRAPPPMRTFRESPDPTIPKLHPALLDAIENVMAFKEPSPIQRQAIPVGLQRRDLIGIAETGSGKTVAFGVPLCHYLLHLPERVLSRVADDGPLALVMAPTRELALQIDGELSKLLSRQRIIRTCPIVGGQAIQNQAQQIRRGVHIIVGTPGRVNDCIEMSYLVLNQCCYIILDEADRMVDMGFLPQVESILDSMGGKLKSNDEQETYMQEMEDLQRQDVASYRITAMFSATMPLEVEAIAKRYLRYPVIVSIGDKDTVKNARIVQKLIWLASPALKEKALREQITNPRFIREKVIVFVNEKKHADQIGRIVERAGRTCVVMHGGKSQEQREENLATFRRGGVVMVATDVAGRGLDIPDVAHVINYDLPTRSIENYTHRIGRTGRAGKDGLATSFITDEDHGIMADLKAYLESTGNPVPERLARHPAAISNVQDNLIF